MKILKTKLRRWSFALFFLTIGLPIAHADPFLAEIKFFAGNFAPRGWAFCDGQILPIAQNQALFSLLGTTYGGDGRTTFGLPDMRGRSPLHSGGSQGPGLSRYPLGRRTGAESKTILSNNLPTAHGAASGIVSQRDIIAPDGSALGVPENSSSIPLDVRDPTIAVNCIIATQGIFPSRN